MTRKDVALQLDGVRAALEETGQRRAIVLLQEIRAEIARLWARNRELEDIAEAAERVALADDFNRLTIRDPEVRECWSRLHERLTRLRIAEQGP